MLAEAHMYGRFLMGLRGFLRDTTTLEQARERVGRRLERRTESLLRVAERGVEEGLFDASKFRLMKESAIFINIGRGMTTKLGDLAAALAAGEIAGAGLDVYEIEPLPSNHPLWAAPNAILTPHVAAHCGAHLEERRYEIIFENVRHLLKGEPLRGR